MLDSSFSISSIHPSPPCLQPKTRMVSTWATQVATSGVTQKEGKKIVANPSNNQEMMGVQKVWYERIYINFRNKKHGVLCLWNFGMLLSHFCWELKSQKKIPLRGSKFAVLGGEIMIFPKLIFTTKITNKEKLTPAPTRLYTHIYI